MVVGSVDVEALCVAEFPRLVGSLFLVTGDRQAARDLAQEAVARALANSSKVAGARSPGAYLHRIAINLARRDRARESRRPVVELQTAVRAGGRGSNEVDADRLDLSRALAALARRQREALVLRFYGDFSVADTARAMGCREGTVKALCHQGLTALRSSPLLGQDDDRG